MAWELAGDGLRGDEFRTINHTIGRCVVDVNLDKIVWGTSVQLIEQIDSARSADRRHCATSSSRSSFSG